MMFHYGFGIHHGHHVLGLLFVLLVIAALVVGVVALVRMRRPSASHLQAWSSPTQGSRVDPALTELRLRYARGELSWQDYAQRSANLGFPVVPGSPAGPDAGEAPPPVP